MKKYVMNKNVFHNKKNYPQGTEIVASDDGFKELVQAGHATVMAFRAEGEPVNESVVEQQVEIVFPDDEAPAKKHGRKAHK